MNKLIAMFATTLFACTLFACTGAQKKTDATDPADMNGPTAEQLASSPCGNSDWSKLPPGSDAPVSDTAAEEPAEPDAAQSE